MNMIQNHIERLKKETGLTQGKIFETLEIEHKGKEVIFRAVAELDAIIDTQVLKEIDSFISKPQDAIILIRFISDYDFSLYEHELFNIFKCCEIHKAFISRTKAAIERIGGVVTIAYMDSHYYETWLGVNDFDDNSSLRETWAMQQIKGI